MIKTYNSNPEKQEAIRQRLVAGLTYRQIAEELGTTRSAVAGYAHRMGYRKSEEVKRLARLEQQRELAAKMAKQRAEQRAVVAAKDTHTPDRIVVTRKASKPLRGADIWLPLSGTPPIMLMDARKDQCKWPVGRHQFCGRPQEHGAYCAVHHRSATRSNPHEGEQDRQTSPSHG